MFAVRGVVFDDHEVGGSDIVLRALGERSVGSVMLALLSVGSGLRSLASRTDGDQPCSCAKTNAEEGFGSALAMPLAVQSILALATLLDVLPSSYLISLSGH